ncbi:cupin domain-containing protein [Enterovibrio coralii]|uniref:Cupin n=1 Tax=Enterovibrio coralii TaxID=294935 RepID=A0A135IA67_9GAMM|nr:hypothetical protein [Enterovibrio coralii]KXF82332.1 hypothetical protein ATN88_09235 [Enterovibrio coralii]
MAKPKNRADLPEGFTYRGTLPTDPNGVELMLEGWDAGTSEPPHCHPGDDMTVMSQGEMHVQFYVVENNKLVKDGPVEIYKQGETAYIRKGQIHSVNYVNTCKLVYVHNGAFDFIESELPMADDA